MMPELSVLCSFRDADSFLPTLLESVARSDFRDIELVMVDDGSVNSAAPIIERYEERIQRVELIRVAESVGPATARNRAMDACTGDLITFVDADDWVGPTYFSQLVATMNQLGCAFARTDQTRVTDGQRKFSRSPDVRYHRSLDPRSAILPVDRPTMVDFPYTHSGVFHRRLLDNGLLKMPDGLRTAEDRLWIWRLHLWADSYARIPTGEYFYRRGIATSLTQVGDDRQLDFIPSFKLVLAQFEGDVELLEYEPKAVRQCLAVATHHLLLIDRLDPALRAMLIEGIRELVAMMPTEMLRVQSNALGSTRQDILRHALPELHHL